MAEETKSSHAEPDMLAGRGGRDKLIQMFAFAFVASVLGVILGLAIDWFPAQGSKQADKIDTFWDVLIICSVPIFVGVTAIVLFSVREFGMKPGQEHLDGPPIHGNTRLEVIWTSLPAAMLVGLCTYAYIVLVDIEKAPADEKSERVITAVGEQFTWTFEYNEDGKKFTTSQLYVPNGESVKFNVRSKDVIHDFWVPAWRMKIDAVPGLTTNFRITPVKTGTFPVVCAELCGLGHAFMRQTAHVLTPEAFDTWVSKQGKPDGGNPAPAGTGAPGSATVDAKALFTDGNSAGATACGACHTLGDAGTSSETGPNLDESLKGKDVDYIRSGIITPDAELAEGFMKGIMPPNYEEVLSPEELDALVKYLSEATK